MTLKGQEVGEKIRSMMEQIRTNIPESTGGVNVLKFRDRTKD